MGTYLGVKAEKRKGQGRFQLPHYSNRGLGYAEEMQEKHILIIIYV